MRRFQKVKNMVKEIKKSSILQTYNSTLFCGDGTLEEGSTPCTAESESCFNLFPLLNVVESYERKSSEPKENDCFDDLTLTHSKKEKNAEQGKRKRGNPLSFRVTRRARDSVYETLANVSELMTNPIGTKIRFNQASTKACKTTSVIHRAMNITEEMAVFKRHQSIDHRLKPKKERLSPKRIRRGAMSRTRRTVSPKKYSSPTRKFSISAWETPEEFETALF